MKKAISFILVVIMMATVFCACGTKSKAVGEWYNSRGKCLDIRDDGTYKLEDDYGTGTWKVLGDKETIEFTDFYGSTHESKINEDELGRYIDFDYYGNFYYGGYPTIDDVKADVFEGLKITTKGASPYCLVEVDTSGCSEFVRQNVIFTVDSSYHKNGDEVSVTAQMSNTSGQSSAEEKTFVVSDAREYVSDVEDLDFSVIDEAIEKYLDEEEKNITSDGSDFFGSLYSYEEIVSRECIEKGFFLANDEFLNAGFTPGADAYNIYYCEYVFEVYNPYDGETNGYLAEVYLKNICENSDGSTVWSISFNKDDELNEFGGRLYKYPRDFYRYNKRRHYKETEDYNLEVVYKHPTIDLDSLFEV